ncbi:MAG: hypothetical protein IT323_11835 [Anaerolineae bacterium]|nr:hypothetical protein [Anaerolineae bacterium]
MEQSYSRDYSTTSGYATSAIHDVEKEEQLPNNVAAVALFAALGVVAAVLTFFAARARRKPKTARERLMELVENGRVLAAQIAEQVKTGVRDGVERIRNR